MISRRSLVAILAAGALAGCDDQIKYIPIFSTMSWQPSVEAFEEAPRVGVAGTMPIDGERTYTLIEADTALSNPTASGPAELARGKEIFDTFCIVCHGATGQGNGSVVGPNRVPDIPLLNLTSELTRGYSDGYIWGMITNGRGLMPSYRRIPAEDRWYVVDYVRSLQRTSAGGGGGR